MIPKQPYFPDWNQTRIQFDQKQEQQQNKILYW